LPVGNAGLDLVAIREHDAQQDAFPLEHGILNHTFETIKVAPQCAGGDDQFLRPQQQQRGSGRRRQFGDPQLRTGIDGGAAVDGDGDKARFADELRDEAVDRPFVEAARRIEL
jgi:hypothetical protein